MTNRLFDLQSPSAVEFDPDDLAKWTIGFDLQAATAATDLSVQDPCLEPDVAVTVSGTSEKDPDVYHVLAFAAGVRAKRNVRCAMGEELQIVGDLLKNGGGTGAAEHALWNGVPSWDAAVQPSFSNTDVQTSAVGATAADTVAAALIKYATLTPLDAHVLHLGLKSAMELSAAGYFYTADTTGTLTLRATGAPVVISPYYPAAGVAVSGPIRVQVGPPQAIQVYDHNQNRTRIWGNELIALSLDPSTVVVAT